MKQSPFLHTLKRRKGGERAPACGGMEGARRALWGVALLVSTGFSAGFVATQPPSCLPGFARSGSAWQGSCTRSRVRPLSASEGGGRRQKSLKDILNEDLNDMMTPRQHVNGASGGPEHDFDLNRGLAIDTLLKDYPYLLQSPPDFEIFRKEIVLQDAQGFSISGLAAYQLFFAILRRLAQTASGLGVQPNVNVMLMDKYASDKGKIRLRWKIELFQKGRTATPLSDNERDAMLDKLGFKKPATQDGFSSGNGILEGISVYRLDAKGMISTHTIEVTEPTALAPLQALQRFFPAGTVPIPSGF